MLAAGGAYLALVLPVVFALNFDWTLSQPDTRELDKIEKDFAACEMRLKEDRKAFDMKGYLTVGSILDRLRWQFTNEKIKLPAVRQQIEKVLSKIGEKVRACPDD